MTKLKLLTGTFGNTLAADILPSLQALAKLWLENKEKGDQFKGVASDIVDVVKGIALAAITSAVGLSVFTKELGAIAAKAEALNDAAKDTRSKQSFFQSLLDPFGTKGVFDKAAPRLESISSDFSKDFGDAAEKVKAFYDALYNPPAAKTTPPKPKGGAGALGSLGAGGDDPTKKLYENAIKALEAMVSQEKDLLC